MFGKNKSMDVKTESEINIEIPSEIVGNDYPPVRVIQICQLLPDRKRIWIKYGHRYTYYKGKVMFVPPEMYDWEIRDISVWRDEVGVFVDSNEKYNEIAERKLKKKIIEHYAKDKAKTKIVNPLSKEELFNLASKTDNHNELIKAFKEHKDEDQVAKFICMNPKTDTGLLKSIYTYIDNQNLFTHEKRELIRLIARHTNIDDSLAWVIYCESADDYTNTIHKALVNNPSISEPLREQIKAKI